ncbi:dethiobiotin synthase [Kribbella monticola]|uniref:dethiobiotin synthase n=1 Tax=Kribbella monticola TaxID=2185285 RepID=UPI000DD2C1B4|nr:dethiobiotin synthase [Kribbella monticola]
MVRGVTDTPDDLPSLLFVTGTDTGVGKTVVTAALASYLDRAGPVGVFKPFQTGVGPDEPGDAAEVERLIGGRGIGIEEGVRLRDPLAPTTAARREGVELPSILQMADRVVTHCLHYWWSIVEGAGGLLVGLDAEGRNLADLAAKVTGWPLGFVIVTRSGLGTLNHTMLTVEALRARNLPIAGLVIGSWPEEPDLADHCNLEDLPTLTGVPIIGSIPANAAALTPTDFRAGAETWFDLPWREISTGRIYRH